MARETKIGLLVGLAFIILFGIILSEKGTGRNDQLSTPPIAAYKPVVELIPPTAPPSAQLSKTNKDEVADRLTMTDPGLKLTDQTPHSAPTGMPQNVAKPADIAAPAEKIQLAPTDIAPKLKPLLPPAPTKSLTQIPAANPTMTDKQVVAQALDQAAAKSAVNLEPLTSATEEEPKVEASKTHTVQQGETLASICRQYYPGQAYDMLKQVMTYNKINKPEKLMVGQVIKLPEIKQSDVKPAEKELAANDNLDTNGVISKFLVPADDDQTPEVAAINSKSVKVTLVPEDKSNKTKKEIVPVKLAKAKNPGTYVVQSNDTLTKIAKRVYGTEKAWTKIYKLNKKLISDPRNLKSGQKLRIPEDELASGPKLQE